MQYQFALFKVINLCVIENSIEFAPKYRRKVIYNELGKGIGEILRKLCKEMKVEIIEACPDYIHMLVSILKL